MFSIDSTEALKPGSRVYFRVHDPELGSGITWSLHTKKELNDVYGSWWAQRKKFHFSFHDSGQTHYASTVGPKEHVAKRPLSQKAGPHTWFAKRIAVPRSELSPDWAEQFVPLGVVNVPLGSCVDGVGLDFYLLDEGVDAITFEQATFIALLERGRQGYVLVVATPLSLDGPVHEVMASEIDERSVAQFEQFGAAGFPFRDVLICDDPDHPGLQRDIEVLFRR